MSEKHKQIIREVDAAFSENNIEVFFAHCAENIEWEMCGESPKKGLQAIKDWMASMPSGGEPKINGHEMIAEGDKVAAYGKMTMKNEKGEIDHYDYCDIYRFENDKIVNLKSFGIKLEKE